jgi:hypothetical protein
MTAMKGTPEGEEEEVAKAAAIADIEVRRKTI